MKVVSTDKKMPSKGVSEVRGSTPSNPQRPNEDPGQIIPSGIFHPKLVKALSQVPYSPLFGILWPIIVEQASFETQNILRKVNPYFKTLCRPYRDSDWAKYHYASHFGNEEKREGLPFVLDLSFGVEWRSWSADKCAFNSVEAFRAFCAIGDIDPDQGSCWNPYSHLTTTGRSPSPFLRYIWMSRTKDVVFETVHNPLKENGYCFCIGLTGAADKAIAMYNFMHDKHNEEETYIYYDDPDPDDEPDEPAMSTVWEEIAWGRVYM